MRIYPKEVIGLDPNPYRKLYEEFDDGLSAGDILGYASAWKAEGFLDLEVILMISNPVECEGILMPSFLRAKPAHFVTELNEDIKISLRNSDQIITTSKMQMIVLEIILNMWTDHLYDPDYYVRIYQDQ